LKFSIKGLKQIKNLAGSLLVLAWARYLFLRT